MTDEQPAEKHEVDGQEAERHAAGSTRANGASEVVPEPWMVCEGVEEFRAGLARVTPDLGPACRRAAEAFTPERSYRRALALLSETAS